MSTEAVFLGRDATICCLKWQYSSRKTHKSLVRFVMHSRIRASHFPRDENVVYKQLGLFSKKRVIEDAVLRAKMLAPTALELEEGIRIKLEEMVRQSNLWHDPDKSHEILVKLADSAKAVAALKDIKYKVTYYRRLVS
uniref:Uncharacterized protein MANES_09G016400 n=1 Tax=Rhizophora mucronata TaxID=61149 RepID=A0A2P2JME8_RHIMU